MLVVRDRFKGFDQVLAKRLFFWKSNEVFCIAMYVCYYPYRFIRPFTQWSLYPWRVTGCVIYVNSCKILSDLGYSVYLPQGNVADPANFSGSGSHFSLWYLSGSYCIRSHTQFNLVGTSLVLVIVSYVIISDVVYVRNFRKFKVRSYCYPSTVGSGTFLWAAPRSPRKGCREG